ncbi:FAD-binding oxidoreductase [Agrobacterium sp. V1]|uniref:FAD-binding oxidoreductase n=1 Tax=Agrobacterium sp. V1 TaxID=3061957 RepID=UPI002671B777|nr:FAD-binding oxidoreductase [Agrobacterium sp. V1]MDO3444631.1 FAD-binding oxidoreductase [Agrobacterium sp. V1]
MNISGWGRYPSIDTQLYFPRDVETLRNLVNSKHSLIARGNGRAYGDSAINPFSTISMKYFNHMLSFQTQTGQLVAEAGVLLGDVIKAFLPRGWFPMVTPGTKFVTLGGMIAADIHGKNHHKEGSFRTCVDWIDVLDFKGETIRCSHETNTNLFEHTLGGMGLTGIILRAAFRLKRVETSWIRQTTVPAPNLQTAIEVFEKYKDATYSVAWIDCLGRGKDLGRSLIMLGEHASISDLPAKYANKPFAQPDKREVRLPITLPSGILNRITVSLFNKLYYEKGARKTGEHLVDCDSYFYPLDAILGWNRIYGRSGFAQFQCVLPLDRSEKGITALLEAISLSGAGSFLAVLKRLGPQDSKFSFPMEGYTLALDFPISRKTLRLLKHLDEIAVENGGRFYLAKDSRMSARTLRASDARVEKFINNRDENGWKSRFISSQAERLSI